MKNTYKATMDSYANDVTAIATLFLIAVLLLQCLILQFGGEGATISLSLFLISLYSGAYLFKPTGYEITEAFLIIHMPSRNVTIPIKNLNKVEIIGKEKMERTRGLLGARGFFGYSGKFTNPQIGNFTAYATRKSKMILIQTDNDKKFILTPDKPAKFIKQLKD